MKPNKARVIVRLSLMTLIVFVACATSSNAQDSSVLKPCEQAIDELKVKRVEVEGLRQQIVLRDEKDKLRDQFEANQAEQIAFWKEAATARKEALSLDDRIEKIRLEQIVEYKDEITRLRTENEKLRRSRDKRFLIGTVLGTVVGGFILK